METSALDSPDKPVPADADASGLLQRYRPLLMQFVAFGIVGVGATLVNIAVYYAGVKGFGASPNVSWTAGFLVALVVSYTMQRRFVFSASGERSVAASSSRFFMVALLGFALNSLWVWAMVTRMGLPTWSPLPLVLFVTPAVTYCLNRFWVFR
jgi:putative flippase GtrA